MKYALIRNDNSWRLILYVSLLVVALPTTVSSLNLGTRFLLISSTNSSRIYYAPLPSLWTQSLTRKERRVQAAEPRILIDRDCLGPLCEGVQAPASMAVFEGTGTAATLYVADTKARAIYAYWLSMMPTGTLSASSRRIVQPNVTALGLAVDSIGNLFYTTAENGQVLMLGVDDLSGSEESRPKVLYQSGAGPRGIASDNFFVYWANSKATESTGAVARAPELVESETPGGFEDASQAILTDKDVEPIAANADLYQSVAENLCLARDVVFFTGGTGSIFAVKSDGGTIVEIAQGFAEPGGCVYDEESTLYFTDKAEGTVYSLPANFPTLRVFNQSTVAYKVEAPGQLAIFGTRRRMAIHSGFNSTDHVSAVVYLALLFSFLSVMNDFGV